MPAGNAFSKTVLGALSALLVACAALPGTDLTFRINPRTGAVEPVNPAGPIAVKLVLEPQAPIRETLAVPSNWASIKVTLTNATLLAADKVTTINQAAGSTVPASGAVFSNLRTGSGYAVSVLLYSANDLGGTLLSRGTTSGVTLNAGSNTVTISLLDATTINGAVSDGVPSSITVGGVTINLNAPIGVVTDSSGNAFFADASCRIFKRASSGTYSVLAGSGTCATSTECSQTTNGHPGTTCDGTGASAKLGTPQNMTIDSSGNIYFSETGGKCLLRRSNPGGTVETLLGNGCGYSNATSYGAKFENPEGVLRDSAGDIIISDTGNHKLRKVFVSDGQPSNSFEVGGNAGYANNASGKSGVKFSSPKGICFDSTGNYIYIADSGNHVIRKMSIQAGDYGATFLLAGTAQTSGADDGAPGTGKFNSPAGLSLGADGFLYVADTGGHKIRKVNTSNGTISTVAGNGSAGCNEGTGTNSAMLSSPKQVYRASDGSLWIANSGCNKVSIVQ